jgi:SPW repeat
LTVVNAPAGAGFLMEHVRHGSSAMFKALQWEDWVVVALGAWMLASPWVLRFSDSNAATFNALAMGTVLVLFEFMEYEEHEPAKDWFDLAVGVWLMISPAVLGFGSLRAACASAVTVGLLATLLAIWTITPLDRKISNWLQQRAARR